MDTKKTRYVILFIFWIMLISMVASFIDDKNIGLVLATMGFTMVSCFMVAIMIRREEHQQWKMSKDSLHSECKALRRRCWDYEQKIDELESDYLKQLKESIASSNGKPSTKVKRSDTTKTDNHRS